jgi:hypothetical protein
MKSDDEKPHLLMGRAGLVFAYVCFAIALGTIGAAIYLLPLELKVKIFLAAAATILTSMFVFMAVATYLVSNPGRRKPPADPPGAGTSDGS